MAGQAKETMERGSSVSKSKAVIRELKCYLLIVLLLFCSKAQINRCTTPPGFGGLQPKCLLVPRSNRHRETDADLQLFKKGQKGGTRL